MLWSRKTVASSLQILAGGATDRRRPGKWHDREGKILDSQCHILYRHGGSIAATGRLGRPGTKHQLFPPLAKPGSWYTRDSTSAPSRGILYPCRCLLPRMVGGSL